MSKKRRKDNQDDKGVVELTFDFSAGSPRDGREPPEERLEEPPGWGREGSGASERLADEVIARQKRSEARRRNRPSNEWTDDLWGTELEGSGKEKEAWESLFVPGPENEGTANPTAVPEPAPHPLSASSAAAEEERPLPPVTDAPIQDQPEPANPADQPEDDWTGRKPTWPLGKHDGEDEAGSADDRDELADVEGDPGGRGSHPTAHAPEPRTDAGTAGVGRRFLAGVLDFGIVVTITGILLLVARVTYGWGVALRLDGDQLLAVELAAFPLAIILFLIAGTYFTASVALFGRTVGKSLFHLRVIDPRMQGISWPRALVRFAVSCLLSPGFLWAALDRKSQAWHDKLAGTLVVRDEAA